MSLNSSSAFCFLCNRIQFLLIQLGLTIFSFHAFAQSELFLKGTPLTFYDYDKSSFVLIDDSQSFQVYNFELGKFERFDLKFAADTSFQYFRNTFVPISTPDDGTYFVHGGCGVVYHFAGDSLYRHDASFYHRNQFNAYFFEHDNQIFMLGGYGMFTEKNILVQYNKLSRDWLLVPYHNAAPSGFLSPIVHKIDNVLYLLAYKNHGDADFNDAVFTYDLKANSWAQLGKKTEQFLTWLNSDKQDAVFNNNIIRVKNGALVLDVKGNIALRYENPIFATTLKIVQHPDKPEWALLLFERTGAHELIAKVAHKDELFGKLIDTFPIWEPEENVWEPWKSSAFLITITFLLGALLGGFAMHLFWKKRSVKKLTLPDIHELILPKQIENDLLHLFLEAPNHSLEVSRINTLVDEENISTEALKKRRERLLKDFCLSLATIYGTAPNQILQETKHPKDGRVKILELSKTLFINDIKLGKKGDDSSVA
jgi:hypothetical protein